MKIGIIGMGSIGQRHIKCLDRLGYRDIVALRTKKGTTKSLPDEFKYVQEVFNYDEFLSNNLEGIIISNPTSFHIESLKKCISKKIPIFIEKPIADSMSQIKEIDKFDTSKIMVGFNHRYNELINLVKEYILSGKLGDIYKANLYCGQYLPLWHPNADYREEYYSKKDLGGGALRTLCHEIDLMHYFFKMPKELIANLEKLSNLEIDVEDNVYMLGKINNKFLVKIELDYLNPIATKKGTIFGSKGKLDYSLLNFSKSSLIFTNHDGKKETLYKNNNLDWNQMFMDQMHNFISFIKNNESMKCNFKQGINVMKVIEAAELSNKLKSWVVLK